MIKPVPGDNRQDDRRYVCGYCRKEGERLIKVAKPGYCERNGPGCAGLTYLVLLDK